MNPKYSAMTIAKWFAAWAGQEAQAAEPADASGRTMKGRLRSQQRKEKRLGAVDAHLPKHDGQRRER